MQGWKADLSNGETAIETPDVAGDYTAWRKLLNRLKEENLKITRLTLVRGSTEVLAMPPKMCEGYFHAYEDHLAFFSGKKVLSLQGIGSVVKDQVFIAWSTLDGLHVRSDVRPLDSCKIHTTIQ